MTGLILLLVFAGVVVFVWKVVSSRFDNDLRNVEQSQRYQDRLSEEEWQRYQRHQGSLSDEQKPRQSRVLTAEERAQRLTLQVFKWVAVPAGVLLVVFLVLSQGDGGQPVPSDGEINWDIVYEPTQEQFDYCLDNTNYEVSENPTCEEILLNASTGSYYEDPETGDPYIP